jgi:hypothetical protein
VLEPAEVIDFPQFRERGMLRRTDWGAIDALYPAWIDDKPPRAREPFVEIPEEALASLWT